MKKIFWSSIEGIEDARTMGEIVEAEFGEEWRGDVAAYIENLEGDHEYLEGSEHIPGDVQQNFGACEKPENICVELVDGSPALIWWAGD